MAAVTGAKERERARKGREGREMGGRTAEVLAAVASYLDEHGYPPTLRELCTLCGLSSTSQAHYHLARLVRLGRIVRAPARSRAIALVREE